jgi:type IV pilus assembly protein PilN
MARINLLPWRAERRKQRQKEFMAMLGLSALAAVVLSFLLVNYYSRQIDGQNERNQFLEQRIAQVQKQIDEIKTLDEKKARLLKRKEIIEDLQADRSQMVHLFDSLVRTIPDGVVLTSIKQEGDKLSLEGRSQSNARVSAYMRSLEGSGWMTQPQLSIIEAKEGDPGLPFTFSMSVTLANPNAPKDADGDGKPDEAPATAPAATPAPAAAPAAASSTAGAAS